MSRDLGLATQGASPDLHQQVLVVDCLGLALLSWHPGGAFVAVGTFSLLDIPEFAVQVREYLVLGELLASLPHDMLEYKAVASNNGLVFQRVNGGVTAALEYGEAQVIDSDYVACYALGD